jgi:CheY-like chemotaxis protein
MAKILLVEDDQFIREIYEETLKSKGHEITLALDGEDAYEKMKSAEQFDLILLDIVLPKITGLDLVRKLIAEGKNLKDSIIFSTNSDAGKDLDDALQLGAGYIIKSNLTPDAFAKRIEEFLKKKETTGAPTF